MELTSSAIAHLVEEHWPLTAVDLVGGMNGYSGAGVVRLATDQGQFVLKSANLWDSAATAAEHTAIFGFLAAQGFLHAPHLLSTKAGDAFIRKEDRFLYVMEFVPGRPPAHEPESYRRLGEVAAALHNLRGYTHPQQCGIYWLDLMARETIELLPSGADVARVLAAMPDFSGLPEAIVHGELGQAIEDPTGRLVLVDWDEAGALAFYEAYFAGRPPSQPELDRLVPLAVLYALAYARFADTEQRVARALFAVKQADTLTDITRSCLRGADPRP
jgi:hypothetical protein